MSAEPTLLQVLGRVMQNVMAQSYTARPARVDAWDSANGTVDVTPVFKETLEGDDATTVQEPAAITKVPVCWPRAGDWFLSMPIAVGDYVLLVFADRSMDIWQQRGGVVDPIDLRRHNVTDAIAIPGVYPKPDVLTESDLATDFFIGEQGGAGVRIKTDGTIELGATAGTKQGVALGDDVRAELDAIKADLDALNGHTHTLTGACGNGGALTGPTLGGPSLSYAPSDVKSTTVFAEE